MDLSFRTLLSTCFCTKHIDMQSSRPPNHPWQRYCAGAFFAFFFFPFFSPSSERKCRTICWNCSSSRVKPHLPTAFSFTSCKGWRQEGALAGRPASANRGGNGQVRMLSIGRVNATALQNITAVCKILRLKASGGYFGGSTGRSCCIIVQANQFFSAKEKKNPQVTVEG